MCEFFARKAEPSLAREVSTSKSAHPYWLLCCRDNGIGLPVPDRLVDQIIRLVDSQEEWHGKKRERNEWIGTFSFNLTYSGVVWKIFRLVLLNDDQTDWKSVRKQRMRRLCVNTRYDEVCTSEMKRWNEWDTMTSILQIVVTVVTHIYMYTVIIFRYKECP